MKQLTARNCAQPRNTNRMHISFEIIIGLVDGVGQDDSGGQRWNNRSTHDCGAGRRRWIAVAGAGAA